MAPNLWFAVETAWRFRCYRRKKVTPREVLKWLHQFEASDHKLLRKLIRSIKYVADRDLARLLLNAYQRLISFLKEKGFQKKQIVFLSFDQAGSSSSTMLNLLRDEAHLENQEFHLVDARDINRLNDLTYELGEGVLIYVDDFIGSGKQLTDNIKLVRPYVRGNFAESVLAICICEEAAETLEAMGVRIEGEIRHSIRERPLHDEGAVYLPTEKARLIALCKTVAPPIGLGFRKMATMVVLSRNTPNNCPMVFRGAKGQQPFVGILPRTTDLEVPQELRY